MFMSKIREDYHVHGNNIYSNRLLNTDCGNSYNIVYYYTDSVSVRANFVTLVLTAQETGRHREK